MKRSTKLAYAALAAVACTTATFAQGTLYSTPATLPPAPPVAPAAPIPPAPVDAVAAASAPATTAANQKVLIIPFTTYNVPDNEQWIPKAVQEDLIAALGATRALSPVPFEGQVIVEDNATAARLAKNASTAYAVRGAAQVVEGNIRITAQLIDANTGEAINSASVTGPINSLLAMEDGLSAQLLGLPMTAASMPGTVGQIPIAPAAPQVAAAAPTPQIIVVPQAQPIYTPAYYPSYSDYYPYDNYYSSYPYYYGGYYPGIFFGTVFSGNRFDHGHDHDHDHDGHGGHGGFDGGGFDGGGFHGGEGHIGPRIVSAGGGASSLPLPTRGASFPIPTTSFSPTPQHLSLPVISHGGGFGAPAGRGFSQPTFSGDGGMMRGGRFGR